MCLAMLSPAGTTVPKEHLEEAFNKNPDGAGFAYAKDDVLHIVKGLMTFDDLWSAYEPHQDLPNIIHVRITTHGNTDKDNTHPFSVGKNLCMIHNGIINAVDRPDKTKSDTYWFNQKILVPVYRRDSRFIFKDHFKGLVKEYIGHSKLVFLNNKGHHAIINEDKGVWDEGVWYSNTSYKPRQVVSHNEKKGKQELFTVGSRVRVEYEFNKTNNGFGVVSHFGNGQMVGIKMDGQEAVRLIHMSFIYPVEEINVFAKNDWVVKKDNPSLIGEVQGIIGTGVVVRWLNSAGVFSSPDFVISSDKLEHWWTEEN